MIAGMLVFIGIKIISEAAPRLMHPVIPQITAGSLVVLLFTLAVNILVSYFELNQGRKLKSDILISDSMHTRSDIYITVAVLVTLFGIKLGLPPIIDPIASFIVCGFIFYAAYKIFKSTSDILLDRAVVDENEIRDIVTSFSEVKDCHKIRSRGRADEIYIDLHIMVDPAISVEESHQLTHSIAGRINEKLNSRAHVSVHIEPFSIE